MYLTLEDLRKIEDYLKRKSIKDTQFDEAITPLDGEEEIAFVQNGKNVKAHVKDIVEQLFLLGVSDFVNITDKYNQSYIDLKEAIDLIPFHSRKKGQVITFINKEGDWVIYQFKGYNTLQWNNTTLWVNLFESIYINSILPDEEDLTKTDKDEQGNVRLKFKDKVYDPENFSGLGRVYLRKNIMEGKNVLLQEMISEPNTIYHIQYDYDLNGETITIPENCVLEFNGGKLNNGVLLSNKTKIINVYKELNIYGKIYDISGNEISIKGDIIKRPFLIMDNFNFYGKEKTPYFIDEYGNNICVKTARDLSVTDFIVCIRICNNSSDYLWSLDTNDNYMGNYQNTEQGYQECVKNGLNIYAIKFYTTTVYKSSDNTWFRNYCNFILEETNRLINLGLKFDNVYIINEHADWNSYSAEILQLCNSLNALGKTARISYDRYGQLEKNHTIHLDKKCYPDLNFYPTLSVLDKETVFNRQMVDGWVEVLEPIKPNNIFNWSELIFSECGTLPSPYSLRNPSWWNVADYIELGHYDTVKIYFKTIIGISKAINIGGIAIWYMEQYNNEDIKEYLYKLFINIE